MKWQFKSGLADKFEEFSRYLESAGKLNNTYYQNLHLFDNYLAERFTDEAVFSEPMLEWCKPRATERGNSCRVRTTVVRNFVKYARLHGWTEVIPWKYETNVPTSYIPHYFTDDELKAFFIECDRYFIDHPARNNRYVKLNRLELPIYYRLLLSTGLRTCEARWLKQSDVDFETGVVNIRKSKGHDEHRIVLGDSALEMLRKYDIAMERLMPNRTYLFPDSKGGYHAPEWGSYYFRIIWSRVSTQRACEYDLRSMYAVLNISKCNR